MATNTIEKTLMYRSLLLRHVNVHLFGNVSVRYIPMKSKEQIADWNSEEYLCQIFIIWIQENDRN